ncbi:TrmB family transcriptional regulator [Haloarchaeobius sp. HRN-SO-5]|uniref:TrmB family transcriptional regulator n=1 Tax=Haloarchaeobius sp. HRN-SO-5 TaxID=3446118 RepID=UPI003EBDD7AE
MDTEEVREALERAGLTRYQSDAYLTLLDLGIAPAVDVAERSSVPVAQIYKVLDDLEEKGYVETIDREQLHARPSDPVNVLNHLRSYREVLDAADEIENRWKEPYEEDHQMSVVKHQSTIYERVRASLSDADHAIELAATLEQAQDLLPLLRDAHENGIIIRLSVYSDAPSTDVRDELSLDGVALEVRECGIPGPFLAVVDRRHTFFAPNDRSRKPYGVVINDDILSFIFHWYFQTCLWSVQKQIYTAHDGPLPYISIEEFIQDFVTLWRDGVDVHVVAHGWDNNENRMRTVTGRVTDIRYTDRSLQEERPSLEQLAGIATIELQRDDGQYTIGGWGAVFEDMEVYELVVTRIEFTNPI